MMNPIGIDADRSSDTLTIDWEDGHRSRYSLAALRWACPCAVCQGEWGRPGVLSQTDELSGAELRLADVHTVGAYAISPIWESGHNSGIYSFEYLRSICPCDECRSVSP